MADEKTAYFSELIHNFLGETVEAVQASYISQLETLSRLTDLVNMDLDDYARSYVTDEELAAEIKSRGLPPTSLTANDLSELRAIVAVREREAIVNVLKNGLPRCAPSNGKINLKFTYDIQAPTGEASQDDPVSQSEQPAAELAGRAQPDADISVSSQVTSRRLDPEALRKLALRGDFGSTRTMTSHMAAAPTERLQKSPLNAISIDALRRTLASGRFHEAQANLSTPDVRIKTFNTTTAPSGDAGQAVCSIDLEFQFLYD